MSAVAHTQIIPIHEYAAIKAELEFWKNKYFSLQTQLKVKTISNPSAIYIKENGVATNVLLNNMIMLEADSNYTIITVRRSIRATTQYPQASCLNICIVFRYYLGFSLNLSSIRIIHLNGCL